MEFNKVNAEAAKGVGVIFMLLLHLFAAEKIYGVDYSLYSKMKDVGNFCNMCVPIFVFITGYSYGISNNVKKILKKTVFLYLIALSISLVFVPISIYFANIEFNLKKFIATVMCIKGGYNKMYWYISMYPFLLLAASFFNKIKNKYFFHVIIALIFIFMISQRFIPQLSFPYMITYYITKYIELLLFLFIGLAFKKNEIYKNINLTLFIKTILCILFFIINCILWTNVTYDTYILYHCIIVPFFVFIITNINKKITILLSIIGKYSLYMWLIHGYFFFYFPKLVYWNDSGIIVGLTFILFNLIIAYIFNFVITKVKIKDLFQTIANKF